MVQAEGTLAIVIDVLRASTTIVTALGNGASAIIPLATVEEARARQAQEPHLLLGGERNAHPLPGFDFGNSPLDYTPEKVQGREVILTTTNGTRALQGAHQAGASAIIVGALTNRQAVVDFCSSWDGSILLVCAGSHGRFSLEDALCAGAIIAGLDPKLRLTDGARTCRALYEHYGAEQLPSQIASSDHGLGLKGKGYGPDVVFATALDVTSLVPIYRGGEIRPLEGKAIG